MMRIVFAVIAITLAGHAAAYCSARYPSAGTLSDSKGTIFSDPDGSFSKFRTKENQDCVWTVQCPSGSGFTAIRVNGTGTLPPSSKLRFYTAEFDESFPNGAQLHSYRAARFPAASVSIQFHTLGDTGSGWTLDYECMTSQTTSPNATSATGTSGFLTHKNYESFERAFWTITCAAGSYVEYWAWDYQYATRRTVIRNGEDILTVGDNNVVRDSANTARISETNSINVTFAAGTFIPINICPNANTCPEWTLYYRCLPSKWAGTQTVAPDTVISSYDHGTGPDDHADIPRLPHGTEKTWTLQCNAGQNVALGFVTSGFYPLSSIFVVDGDGTPMTFTSFMSITQEAHIFNTTSVTVTLNNTNTYKGPLNLGMVFMNFTYRCLSSGDTCTAANGNSSAPVSIQTDIDGAGPFAKADNEYCVFNITCPTGYTVAYSYRARYDWSKFFVGTNYMKYYIIPKVKDYAKVRTTNQYMIVTNPTDDREYSYECRKPCESPEEGTTLEGATGVIRTDADGASNGSTTMMADCSYTKIKCPAGYKYLFMNKPTNVKMRAYEYNETASSWPAISNYNFYKSPVFETSSVNFTFGTSSVYEEDGYDINYECTNERCQGVTHTNPDTHHGIIIVDQLYIGQDCDLTITCPSGTFLGMRGYGSVFTLNMTGIQGTKYLSTQMKFYDTTSAQINVKYAVNSYQPSYSTSYLAYTCTTNATCPSPNASGTTFTEPSGRILLDYDGTASYWKPPSNGSCLWYINCPSNATGLTIYLSSSALNIRTFNAANMSDNTTSWGMRHSYTSAVLQWESVSYGGYVNYVCFVPAPPSTPSPARVCTSANATGETFTAASGTLGSGNGYAMNEKCDWTITCPSGNVHIRGLTGRLGDKDRVWFTNAADSSVLASFNGTATNHLGESMQLAASSVGVHFESYLDTMPSNSHFFKLTWACNAAADVCSSANASNVDLTAASGFIYSDMDGMGRDYPYGAGERCVWPIKCPAANGTDTVVAMRIAVYGQTKSAKDTVLVESVDHTTGHRLPVARFYETMAMDGIYDGNETYITFVSEGSAPGFLVYYECLTTKHMSKTAQAVINATNAPQHIVTEASDGAASGPWTIQCLPENGPTNLVLVANGADNKQGSVVNARGVLPHRWNSTAADQTETTGFDATYPTPFAAVMAGSSVNITIMSHVFNAGTNVTFLCMTDAELQAECGAAFVDHKRVDGGVVVGTPVAMYNLNCTHTMTCPAATSIDVWGARDASGHADGTVFTLEDTTGECVAPPYTDVVSSIDGQGVRLLGNEALVEYQAPRWPGAKGGMRLEDSMGSSVATFGYHCAAQRTTRWVPLPSPGECSVPSNRNNYTDAHADFHLSEGAFPTEERCLWLIENPCNGSLALHVMGGPTDFIQLIDQDTGARKKAFCGHGPHGYDHRVMVENVGDRVAVLLHTRGRRGSDNLMFEYACTLDGLWTPPPPSGASLSSVAHAVLGLLAIAFLAL